MKIMASACLLGQNCKYYGPKEVVHNTMNRFFRKEL